ncbi:HK97 family phage prohead protease [Clostridium botulinum]|uniref:HK97 family phage prohead protease n=1 Tax=Clostridium botulinum TaxID=1491 RepID=A0A6M0SPV7_CLOBO|nr:HK97 family phage prohead protease [Clostridium botulinum]NFO35138.1 HK97 family phage prohead protease [Clostridium botulinum]NFO48384.1 HK97 family phage prohead protease [Clostridium botulinum]
MRIEIRSNKVILDGYVNAVCRDSKPLMCPRGLFVEQIKEGVFTRALERATDVKLLFNHKGSRQLGSIKQGNLQLFEDNIGLRAIAEIEDPEVMDKAKSGLLQGWSFGFIKNSDKWEESEPYQRRYVEDMELLEVSILDKTPAYNGTSVEARDNKDVLTETRGSHFKAVIEEMPINEVPEDPEDPEKRNIDYSKFEETLKLIAMI